MTRFSVVKSIKIRSIQIAGTGHFGDSYALVPRSKVLAVARELPIFSDEDDDVSQYEIYTRPIQLPPITDEVQVTRNNEQPYIRAGHISIHGVSTSGIVHIGSTKHIDTEARVKHMRQFLFPPKPVDNATDTD